MNIRTGWRLHTSLTRRTLLQLSLPASVGGLATLLYLSARADAPQPSQPAGVQTRSAQPEATRVPTPTTPPLAVTRPLVLPQSSRAGDNWRLEANKGSIKGFVDKVSAADGETITLFVTTPATSFDVHVFRVGWYESGSKQGKLIQAFYDLPGRIQPSPEQNLEYGLISAANWTSNATFRVDGWRTGLYLLKLVASDGDQNYIPLVVRDDLEQHDYLVEHSATTDQAYNAWGGKSLYEFNSSSEPTASGSNAAVKVSFDRPYEGDGSGGSLLRWELNMVRWMESEQLDVAYVSDLDVHRDSQFDARARAVLQIGHSEYWSKEMRDYLEGARDRGKGVGFFTGDTGAWAIRFENSPLGKDRVQVCYKLAKDPLAESDPTHATTHFWDKPLKRPTQQFLGIGSNGAVRQSADWVVEGVDSEPALFSNTGFTNGDVVENLVGYEYDSLWARGAGSEPPPGLRVLGRARVIPNNKPDDLLAFGVSHDWQVGAEPVVGQLATMVETLEFSPAWTFAVHMVSSAGTAYLVYSAGGDRDPPGSFPASGEDQVFFSLGEEFYKPGWRPLNRDLRADYAQVLGPPAGDLRIDFILLRGSLSLGPLLLSAPGGEVMNIEFNDAATPDAQGWRVRQGTGDASVSRSGPSGEPVLHMRVAIPGGRRADDAHAVAIRTPAGGLVVAVGSMQWSWALDDYGAHTDTKGRQTKVDRRLQALTRNILVGLRDSKQDRSGP